MSRRSLRDLFTLQAEVVFYDLTSHILRATVPRNLGRMATWSVWRVAAALR